MIKIIIIHYFIFNVVKTEIEIAIYFNFTILHSYFFLYTFFFSILSYIRFLTASAIYFHSFISFFINIELRLETAQKISNFYTMQLTHSFKVPELD